MKVHVGKTIGKSGQHQVVTENLHDRECRSRAFDLPSEPLRVEITKKRKRRLLAGYVHEWDIVVVCAGGERIDGQLVDEVKPWGVEGGRFPNLVWWNVDKAAFLFPALPLVDLSSGETEWQG